MKKSTEKTRFHSLPQKYAGNKDYDLELVINRSGDNALEFEIINLSYNRERSKKFKQISFLLVIYIMYGNFLKVPNVYTIVLFGTAMLYLIITTLNLIKSIQLMYYDGIALQLETNRFLSKDLYCISASNINDIVINEVVEWLDIHYLLILRTKGSLFKKRPIVPLFNDLKPSVECLTMIHKNLKIVMNNGKQII